MKLIQFILVFSFFRFGLNLIIDTGLTNKYIRLGNKLYNVAENKNVSINEFLISFFNNKMKLLYFDRHIIIMK